MSSQFLSQIMPSLSVGDLLLINSPEEATVLEATVVEVSEEKGFLGVIVTDKLLGEPVLKFYAEIYVDDLETTISKIT